MPRKTESIRTCISHCFRFNEAAARCRGKHEVAFVPDVDALVLQ